VANRQTAAGDAESNAGAIPTRRRNPLHEVLDASTPSNRQLTRGLAALLLLVIATSIGAFLAWVPACDLEIPLRAVDRWTAGGQPYLASSFTIIDGPGLPFLYPPWLLPLLTPLAALPRIPVLAVWLVLGAIVAIWTCRRLSVPWVAVPLVLAWPPFLEGLVAGNIQIWQFAAFVALFYVRGERWQLKPRELGSDVKRDTSDGLLAAGVGAFKYTQLLVLPWLLLKRPRAAIIGGVALAAIIVAMLPFTGIQLYWDWFDQLGRAADPNWLLAGAPLAFVIGRPLSLVASGLAVVGALLVRGRDSGAWVGIALLVAAPSIHGYGMLFLLPALLTIRRDVALALAFLICGYNIYGWWIAIALAGITLLASNRWPALRAPAPTPGPVDAIVGATRN
jgi:hypothetical protein